MNTIRTVTFALGYIAGIALAMIFHTHIPIPVLVIPVIIGIYGSIVFYKNEQKWKNQSTVIVALAIALISIPIGYVRTLQQTNLNNPNSLHHYLTSAKPYTRIKLKGSICEEPQLRGKNNGDLIVRVNAIKIGKTEKWQSVPPANVMVRTFTLQQSNEKAIKLFHEIVHPDAYGYKVEIDTVIPVPEPPLNPGGFNLKRYLSQNNLLIRFKCYISRITIIEKSTGNPITELALKTKQKFIITYKHTIRAPASRLVAAATLGTRHALDKIDFDGLDITNSFRHAGVGHVLAVSGLHVSIVSLLLFTMFRLTGMRPRSFVPIQIAFLLMFAILTGARPSSVRAVVMNSIILIAIAYFKCNIRSATYVGLSVASLFILLLNPLVLLSPGFLLSFGAVLSLVLLLPPLERSLKLLHGFAFFFAILWLTLMVALTFNGMSVFINLKNIIGFIGLLWMGIKIGTALNNRFPKFWEIGYNRMPQAVTMLISAQLAIQIGMMIPMSSWFFGKFPVAGIVVNLVAIPAVGILVQLGIITGLLGLIPVIGTYLALPFGITDTIVGNFFFHLANFGTTRFPYPITPHPTNKWLFLYYAFLALLIFIESQRTRMQNITYRIWPRLRKSEFARHLPYLIPLFMIFTPLTDLIKTQSNCNQITCLADRRFPLVALVADNKTTTLINSGSKYRGSRNVFNAIRYSSSIKIDKIILCSPEPDAGLSAIPKLAQTVKINEILLPATGTTREEYIKNLKDPYLAQMDKQHKDWAIKYGDAYTNFIAQLPAGIKIDKIQTGTVCKWKNAELNILPLPSTMPKKYISSARTGILELKQNKINWLFITDTSYGTIKQTIKKHYDIVVISDLSFRKSFTSLLRQIIYTATPKVVIISGDQIIDDFTLPEIKNRQTPKLFMTAKDGAITATINKNDKLTITSYVTGRKIVLPLCHAKNDN